MNILAEIFSSKVRSEFFRILFGLDSKEYHLRELQRLSGFAIGTVRQEAQKLTGLDLITKRTHGNRTYFYANKQHPLYNLFHQIVLKTSGLVSVLKDHLHSEKIDYAFIFGSVSAGDENSQSDIDIFIVGDIGLREVSKMLKQPSEIIGREINPYVITPKELLEKKRNNDHFISRVLESPKIMIKGTADDFEKLG
jgi:predicted nucleotidyltransferase